MTCVETPRFQTWGEELLRAQFRRGACVEIGAPIFVPSGAHLASYPRSPASDPYAIESQPVAEVAQAAVGGSGAPRPTPQWGMLRVLLTPGPRYHPYACTDHVVSDTSQEFTDLLRDLNSLHGQKRSRG